ncbi:MAG: nucleoside-diphosphate sugar epimerase/dehydratase [Sulfurimonas sp.]|jgi:FlaA1/EpsC-like NDP-sugar epimerase|nr:nucleoside-diphosphate sugar epimerase/dehydratase [Sulfurimonas sp.]
MLLDKRILNFLIIIFVSIATYMWTFFIFHIDINLELLVTVIILRILSSLILFKDYSLSWSKISQKTFLSKSIVALVPFFFYALYFYREVWLYIMISELFTYIFAISFLMYGYHYYVNRSKTLKTKSLVIYGAGRAGTKLEDEFRQSRYKVHYFIDDDPQRQGRSIDGIKIISSKELQELKTVIPLYDLLVIAMPSAPRRRIKEIDEELGGLFQEIKILPKIDEILEEQNYSRMLERMSVEDLLARDPQDLDKERIHNFIKDNTILITGAGGSIGSEIAQQCVRYQAKKIILLDHSEYNLYLIAEKIADAKPTIVMQSVTNKELLYKTFEKHKPDIVIHAAAYKHVPIVEENITEAILNNILGTKNTIDCALEHNVAKFIFVSTDKAVRPTNVMGATKRICELYVQNLQTQMEIVAVRFGNVLGSSGSVIPKFKAQIAEGGPITVTHPDITRYFMLIPEACELVLQTGALGRGGEIFILDMGEPIKIVDLARKMIELSHRDDIEIEFSGLRPGEKLYEELLIDDTEANTQYESITVAGKTEYDIVKLNHDIFELINCEDKLAKLKEMVPEFDHQMN